MLPDYFDPAFDDISETDPVLGGLNKPASEVATAPVDFEPADLGAEDSRPPSSLVSRNVIVAGKRTSIRLEPAYWEALRVVTKRENVTLNDLCTRIHRLHLCSSFTAAVRVVVLRYFWQPDIRRSLFPDRLYQSADFDGRGLDSRGLDSRGLDQRGVDPRLRDGVGIDHRTLTDGGHRVTPGVAHPHDRQSSGLYSNRPHATRRYD